PGGLGGHPVESPQTVGLLVGQDLGVAIGADWPGMGFAKPLTDPFGATELEIVVVPPPISRQLFPFEEGAEVVFAALGFGDSLDEMEAEQQYGVIGHGTADCGEVANDLATEAGPER